MTNDNAENSKKKIHFEFPEFHCEESGKFRPLRVVLLCGVGTGNIGNDASLLTAVDLIRSERPQTEFRAVTPFVDGARALLDLPVHPLRQNMTKYLALSSRSAIALAIIKGEIRRLVAAADLVRGADLLVVTGTGIFDDYGENPWNMPYALLTWAVIARMFRRPFVFLAVGAGPVSRRLSRLQFVLSARLATFVSYRDDASLRFMAGIGAGRDDARVCPDLVFGSTRADAPPARPDRERIVVGLGVMLYGGWSGTGEGPIYEKYVDCLVDIVQSLMVAGHHVRFLVGQPCDIPVVEDVIRRSHDDIRSHLELPEIVDLSDLLEAIGRTDLVIATRYHNVVAALMMRRPVVSMSYAPKNSDLLEALQIGGFDRPIEDATSDWVLARVNDICAGRSAYDWRAWNAIEAWRHQVHSEFRRAMLSASIG